MPRRVRILSDRESALKVIEDNALDAAMTGSCAEDVRRVLEAYDHAAAPDALIFLDEAKSGLANLICLQDGIRAIVKDVVALGGTPMTEEAIYDALALWIIDNQVGRGFTWEATGDVSPPNPRRLVRRPSDRGAGFASRRLPRRLLRAVAALKR